MLRKIIDLCKRRFYTPTHYARSIGVKVGQDTIISSIDFGSEPYLIEIGNNVRVTEGVKFFTHGGAGCFRHKYPNFDFFGKIKIGNSVYIGNNVLIMPGVTIGDNVLVGAGSVVTKSIDNGLVVAGNPAKVITTMDDFEVKMLPYNLNTKQLNRKDKKKHLLNLPKEKFVVK